VIETQERIEEQIHGCEEALRREIRYHLLHSRQTLTEMLAHRGFQNLRSVVAQMAQRSDDAASQLAEAARSYVRRRRQQWDIHRAFLLHYDLRGRQERARLRWARRQADLEHGIRRRLNKPSSVLEPLSARLDSLSPRRILERGYAIVFDGTGRILRNISQTGAGQSVRVQLAHGKFSARVDETESEESAG
jgi:exodeoxyribonuclease VII large subunit